MNIGKKDAYGKQRRIEHRGKYLRASRTGGIALRAQTQAAGMTLTANTKHGFRVSATPLKNTQIALQNGGFILRGRYGQGPTKWNLSKSGVSLSTRNQMGTFNWTRPNRSSVKIAGIQVRGKKAAHLQIAYLLVMLLVAIAQAAINLLQALAGLTIGVIGLLYRLILATPYALRVINRRWRNWRLAHAFSKQDDVVQPAITDWKNEEVIVGLYLIVLGWGRGRPAEQAASRLTPTQAGTLAIPCPDGTITRVAGYLDYARDTHSDLLATDPRALMARLATRLAQTLPEDSLVETLLHVDALALREGPRNRLQDQMLEVFADFAGLRLQECTDQQAQPPDAPVAGNSR